MIRLSVAISVLAWVLVISFCYSILIRPSRKVPTYVEFNQRYAVSKLVSDRILGFTQTCVVGMVCNI